MVVLGSVGQLAGHCLHAANGQALINSAINVEDYVLLPLARRAPARNRCYFMRGARPRRAIESRGNIASAYARAASKARPFLRPTEIAMLSFDFGQAQEWPPKLVFCEYIFRGFGMTRLAYVIVAARRRIKKSAMKFAAATRVVTVGIFALMPTQAMIREIEDANTARSRGTARSPDKESCHRGEENPWPNSAATECTSVIYGMEASIGGRAVVMTDLVWQRPNAEHVGRVIGEIDAHRHHQATLVPFRRSHVV